MLSLTYCSQLWDFVCQPAVAALKTLGYKEQNLVQIEPMEAFNIIWFKLPVLCAIFLAAPWILYQVWAFISPGLYKRERRWAAPFVLGAGGLFILGGFFAYFVVFRYGLTFLLSIGQGNHVVAMVSMTEYFNLFVNVTLGVGLIFELPVLIFLGNPAETSHSRVPDEPQPVRNSRDLYHCRDRHADTGRIQSDVVCGPDVRAVLLRDICRISIGTAPGEP